MVMNRLGSQSEEFEVALHFTDTTDAEVLDQHLGYTRRQEGGECRTEVDVLHTEAQQSEQYDDRLLLIPCDVVGDGQVVDIGKLEDFLELEGDDGE